MSTVPDDLRYSRDHEWVRVEKAQATIGITDHAQREKGDTVYIQLPTVGESFEVGDAIGSIESVKAVAELYAPIGGKIVEINGTAHDDPEHVNDDPYGEGWLVKIQITNASQLDQLLSAEEYNQYLAEGGA
jgi:glycine cleavage system H protein